MRNIKNKFFIKMIFPFSLFSFFLFSFISCDTQAAAERRLIPPRSITEVRLSDISNFVSEDPAMALHLIEVFYIIYGPDTVYPDSQNPEIREQLIHLREEAVRNMVNMQLQAIAERRFTDAASLARSLSAIGVFVENSGDEPEITLEYAKDQLGRNDLMAFLAASQAHELKPLEYNDAFLFLEKAVELRQRRTAAYFLDIADEARRRLPAAASAAIIPNEYREFANGRDSASEMIRGVATVLVDRGVRIERGRAFPERVGGSAFFIDSTGLAITNYHVISSEVDPTYLGYSRLFIRMGDAASPQIPARVIGWDKTLDLALIKAEITPEYVFSVTDWAIPRIGESVLAIGSPVGLERTVTQGIVSALGRRLILPIGDIIQIDAAVNSGNSGGPLLDASGRLVGVVFAGIDRFQGLNFAIPAERLKAALPAMIAGGKADRPWLGLNLVETLVGTEIIYIAPFTPASEQRIGENWFIKSINGKEVSTAQGMVIAAYQDILFPLKPGELINLELIDQDNTVINRLIRLDTRPEVPLAEAARRDTRERIAAALYGMILAPAPSGSSFSPTFLVRRVIRGSIAHEAGLSDNDPVTIRSFRVFENDGYAVLDINVKQRRMGFMETSMSLPALLDSPDTL